MYSSLLKEYLQKMNMFWAINNISTDFKDSFFQATFSDLNLEERWRETHVMILLRSQAFYEVVPIS